METPDIQFGECNPAPQGRKRRSLWVADLSVDLWYSYPEGPDPTLVEVMVAWAAFVNMGTTGVIVASFCDVPELKLAAATAKDARSRKVLLAASEPLTDVSPHYPTSRIAQ